MSEGTFAVLTLLVLAWAVSSNLLARLNVNGPMLFTIAGYLLANPDWGRFSVDFETTSIHLLAELTLALLLFSDAARVNVSRLRHDAGFPARLLLVGLPLSVVLGSLLATWLLGDLSWALACFVGATLAPTDAALSAPVINDRRVPVRVRRVLNVESGLNDGIVTPVVVFTLALAATALGVAHSDTSGGALTDLAVGVIVGLAVGLGTAALVTTGSRRGWISAGGRRLAVLAAALSSFNVAVAIDGNGFIAAFVAGIAFGARADTEVVELERAVELPELLGEVMALAVWFLFGAVLVPVALDAFSVELLAYAALSLTLVRLAPVALALTGAGLDRSTVLFVGWFGPRGLASVVFALLAVEELGETPTVDLAVGAVALTVLLSVLLHGLSAGPLVARFVREQDTADRHAESPRSRRGGHVLGGER